MSAPICSLGLMVSLLGGAAPAFAQDMSTMPGMAGVTMKSKPASPTTKKPSSPQREKPMPPSPAGPDAATEHQSMSGMEPSATTPSVATSPGDNVTLTGTALPAGTAPPPPVPTDHYADRTYPPAANADARALMMHQQGWPSLLSGPLQPGRAPNP